MLVYYSTLHLDNLYDHILTIPPFPSPPILSSHRQDDDREDFLYTSPLGTYDVTKRFLEVMTAVGAASP